MAAARSISAVRRAAVGRRFISTGEAFPSATGGCFMVKSEGSDIEPLAADYFSKGKFVFFGLPGAFTPVCSASMLPGYVASAADFAAKGYEVVCLTPNDKFVTAAWAKDQKVGDSVAILADGNGELTKALDMVEDMSANGMSLRSNRYALVIEDGKVTKLNAEANSGTFEVSDAATMLQDL